jgi:hypothetical protein
MRFKTILTLLTLFGCLDSPADDTVHDLPLQEIGQRITGPWKLKRIENNKGIEEFDLSSDEVKYFDFEGLEGVEAHLTDNHDGTFMTRSNDPDCKLKKKGNKAIIEYSFFFNDNREYEITSLSKDKLVLADSATSWTYIKFNFD